MKNKNFEIAKLALLNEQMGSIKNLEVSFKEESLSGSDKNRIKQAILESVARNTDYPPDELAKLTCKAICLIDSYKH
ncbi:hypothetical protein ACERCG_05300 [Mannheimia sp. E30BD]|uniref:hypothetical protein n=1 Tax=Mannheimia sp. E30BD TaxID=3278708 RepID=UPI00359E8159